MSFRIIAVEGGKSYAYTEKDPHSGSPNYSFTDDFEKRYIVEFNTREDAQSRMDKYSLVSNADCVYKIIEWNPIRAFQNLRDSFKTSAMNVVDSMHPTVDGYDLESMRKRLGEHMKKVMTLMQELGRN